MCFSRFSKKPTLTQFYAIFSLINVQKYFAWLSFRSFPATMAIFSQIGDVKVTPMVESLMHPLLRILTGPSLQTSAGTSCATCAPAAPSASESRQQMPDESPDAPPMQLPRYYHPKNPTGSDFKSPGRGQVGYMGCDGSPSPNGSGEGNLENGPKRPQVNLNTSDTQMRFQ